MQKDLKDVYNWYSHKESYEYMPGDMKKGLKIWEKEVALEHFPTNAHILNIGCGMGREAFCLYDKGYQVTAIDISEPILAIAKQLAEESKRSIEFLLTSGTDLPFEGDSFDIVIIWSQTFGLFYGRENQLHILSECKRVLKKGGIFSFSAHEKEFEEKYYSQYVDGKKFYAYKECYWEIFSMEELASLAEESGLNVLSCQRGEIHCREDGTIIHCICKK